VATIVAGGFEYNWPGNRLTCNSTEIVILASTLPARSHLMGETVFQHGDDDGGDGDDDDDGDGDGDDGHHLQKQWSAVLLCVLWCCHCPCGWFAVLLCVTNCCDCPCPCGSCCPVLIPPGFLSPHQQPWKNWRARSNCRYL